VTTSPEGVDRNGDVAPDGDLSGLLAELRPRVERLVAHEAAEMTALGQQS
jgi:hypothetical protein